MLPVQSCQAVKGKGLLQDVSFGRTKRQVLLIEAETLQAFGIQPGDVRENVTVEGLALSPLAPSTRLSVGEAVLEVVGLCAPCGRVDEVRPGLQEELRDRRGVLARVVRSGALRVGDSIAVVEPAPAAQQDGGPLGLSARRGSS
jgi:MOSC domain-containing protein YiiM